MFRKFKHPHKIYIDKNRDFLIIYFIQMRLKDGEGVKVSCEAAKRVGGWCESAGGGMRAHSGVPQGKM